MRTGCVFGLALLSIRSSLMPCEAYDSRVILAHQHRTSRAVGTGVLPRDWNPKPTFSFSPERTGGRESELPRRSTPCFPGSPRRSSPFNTLLSYVPSVSSELAAAEISPSSRILSFLQRSPLQSFEHLTRIGALNAARFCSVAPRMFLSVRCASAAMD